MPSREINYFLFIVGVESIKHPHVSGDCGIGRTSLRSGIADCRWGVMLVAPQEFVESKAKKERKALNGLTAQMIKRYVLEFFGHGRVFEHFEQKRFEEPDTEIIIIKKRD